MRNDYLQKALSVIDDPYILVNVVSRRVKQLKRGYRPLVESLEKLAFEDTALREIFEGKITYTLPTAAELARSAGSPVKNSRNQTAAYKEAPARTPKRRAKPAAADPLPFPADAATEPVVALAESPVAGAEIVPLGKFPAPVATLPAQKFTLVPVPAPLSAVA